MSSATLTLVPFRHSLRWTRALAIVAGVVPPCAVAVAVGLDDGHLLPGFLLTALVLLVGIVAVGLVVTGGIELVPDGVRHRRVRVASRDVSRVVVRRIQNRDEVTSQRHLFLLDAEGRPLLRMSDRWWTRKQIAQVAEHVGAPLELTDEVVHPSELRRTVPEQLDRRERHPWTWFLVRVVSVAAAALLIAELANAAL